MEILRTEENDVSKFLHDDGSETAIKTVKSIVNGTDEFNNLKINYEDRNKYSIFISISTGCQFKCQFCYLTMKNSIYKKLVAEEILNNIKEAVNAEIKHKPELKEKYVKLSWMGMGDALNQSSIVKEVTILLLDWLVDNEYTKGLDCVDLSTIMPKTDPIWIDNFHSLEKDLLKYDVNPSSFIKDNENKDFTDTGIYEGHRSRFRLFYSLGSAIQKSKEKIIPNVDTLENAINLLHTYSENNKHNVIIHHMFIENLNASDSEVDAFLKLVKEKNLNDYEIRILRYNFCDMSKYKESDFFDRIIQKIQGDINHLKVQISAGNEVKAACGQFLVKKFKSKVS